MTWFKLDDQFPDHPKVAAAGPLAAWVYVCGLAYCSRQLTDGFIPRSVAHNLVDFTGVDVALTDDEDGLYEHHPSCATICAVLCEKNLWKRVRNGYKVHDFLDWQRSKVEVEKERKAARLRQNKRRSVTGDVTPLSRCDKAVSHGEVRMPEVEVEVEKDKTPPAHPPAVARPHGGGQHNEQQAGEAGGGVFNIIDIERLTRRVP